VWTGQQALEHHLVDHLGGLREALDAARAAAYLPDDAPIVELPRENDSLIAQVLSAVTGGGGDSAEAAVAVLPPAVRDLARAVAPLVVYRSDEPLARMEWVDAGDFGE
jgi:protease-4